MNFNIESLSDLQKFAAKMAPLLKAGDFIALEGNLGLGKTTFAKYLISALQGKDVEVLSPTFNIVEIYETLRLEVWHFDLYRLQKPQEIYETGMDEALARALVLVEWSERAETLLPLNRLKIKFENVAGKKNARKLTLTAKGEEYKKVLAGMENLK